MSNKVLAKTDIMKSRTITEENWQQIQNKLNDLIINNENLNEAIQEKNLENENLRQTIDKLYNTNKQLQKINKLMQHNFMTDLNNQKKLYEEEQLYGDTLKSELLESNKDKDMWKLRYFQLEEELQKISNMEKEVLKYIPIQKEFEEKQKHYDQQIEALKAALQEKEIDASALRSQLTKKGQSNNSKKISKTFLNNTEEFDDIMKQNKDLQQTQIELKKKIEQLELIIQNTNQQKQLQDQNQIEKYQRNTSQQQINSSGFIRSDQQLDENKKQQILDRSLDNRRKKMSFNTESDYNNDDNIYSDDNSNNRSSFKIEYGNNFGQYQQQNNDFLSPDSNTRNKQPDQAGALDNLDKKIDYLMRKQSRKISQAFTDLGSQQNFGQDSVKGDNVKSSNNTSFSRPSGPHQGMRKGTQQTEDLEDLLNPRQNTSSFNSQSKSPRSIYINQARNIVDDDDKLVKNSNNYKNEYTNNNININEKINNKISNTPPINQNISQLQENKQNIQSNQRFSFQYENSILNNINDTNNVNQGMIHSNQMALFAKQILSNSEIKRMSDENAEVNRTQEFSCLIEKNEEDANTLEESKNILKDSLKTPFGQSQGERDNMQKQRRVSEEQIQQQNNLNKIDNRNRINSNNSQLSDNKQLNQMLLEQMYNQQQDQIVNNERFLNDIEVNNEILQRIRLSSEELMQQRYQQQQQDEPSPKKKNSKNFKIEQKKRLSFQKELQIKVYKSQNNSEEEDNNEGDYDDYEENLNNEISEDIQLDLQDQNQQNRINQDLNSKFQETIQYEKRPSQQFNCSANTNKQQQKEFMIEKGIKNEDDQKQVYDHIDFQEQLNNNDENIERNNYQLSDSVKVFKGQEILENRIAQEIEKQLALQRRINMMDQEKVNMILLLQQKQDEVEKVHKEEIFILEKKIETLERNSSQMQNLIVQYQIENQQQKEKEIDQQNELDSKKIYIEQLEEKFNIINEQLAQMNILKQKMKELENQLKEKKQTISNLEIQVSKTLRENEKLNEQQNNLQNQITFDMVDKDQLTQKDKELEELKDLLDKIPSEYQEIVQNMQKTVDDIENRMKEEQVTYQRNIQQMKKKHQEQSNEMRVESDSQMIKLQTTQEQMQKSLAEQYQYCIELEKQCQILKNQNAELNSIIKQKQTQFTIQIEQINNENSENFERELLAQRNQLTQDNLDLERNIIELRSQIEVDKLGTAKLIDSLEDQEQLIKQLQKKLEQKDTQLKMQGLSFDENVTCLEKKLNQLDKVNDDLKKSLNQKDQELKKQYQQREEEQQNQHELEQQCKSLEEIFNQFKEEKTQYEKKIMDLVDKIFDLQQQLSIETKEKKEWQKINDNKSRVIEEYKKQLVHLNIDMNSSQVEINVSPQKRKLDSSYLENSQKTKNIQLDIDISEQNKKKQSNINASYQKNGNFPQRMNNNYYNNDINIYNQNQ